MILLSREISMWVSCRYLIFTVGELMYIYIDCLHCTCSETCDRCRSIVQFWWTGIRQCDVFDCVEGTWIVYRWIFLIIALTIARRATLSLIMTRAMILSRGRSSRAPLWMLASDIVEIVAYVLTVHLQVCGPVVDRCRLDRTIELVIMTG